MRTCPTVLKGFRTEYNFSSGVIQSVRSRMYQYIYKGSGLATNNGILSPYVQYVSQSVGRGWDNPLMSKPKYRKCRKTAVRRAGCCLALCASRAETPRHSSTCPSLPKAGGQHPGWPWVPPSLYSRLQTPPCGMACRSARYPAYRMKAPDGPLGWPTAAGPLPSPEYVAASASLCYTPSLRHLPSFLTI